MSSTSSDEQLEQRINERACFKQRSYDTHIHTHQPQLEISTTTFSQTPTATNTSSDKLPSSQIDIVLLGSSALERFKTTGQHTQISQMRFPQIFNAGVGGDKIENVLYRINLGLLRLLKPYNPKVIVLQIGTNNLQPQQTLTPQHLDDYYLLLQALLRRLSVHTQILVLGFFKRTDVDEQCIAQSNKAVKDLVDKINMEEMERQTQPVHRVHWMKPSEEISWEHLHDHIHLNFDGYQIWDRTLYPRIQELLTLYNSK